LLSSANDPQWAGFIQHTKTVASNALAAGLPAADLHLPYMGAYPDQAVNGVQESGSQIASQCPDNNAIDPAPAPAGVQFNGKEDLGGALVNLPTVDTNSLVGILNVSSSQSFYPNSATPTQWGGQLNAVVSNVSVYWGGTVHMTRATTRSLSWTTTGTSRPVPPRCNPPRW
jgi:hypothetical protein